jgi:6-bladed beta-propeller
MNKAMRLRHTLALALIAGGPALLLGQRAQPDGYSPLPAPLLTIGAEGDPDYEFVAVRTAHRLATGDFVVTDWQSPTIRIFSPQGHLIRKLGRKGSGPGEFQAVHDLAVAGDTLIAYDWYLRRVTRLLPTGDILGTQPIQPSAGLPVDLVARLRDGQWLVTTVHMPNWSHGHGVYRDTLQVGVLGSTGSGPVAWLATSYPGMTMFAYMPSQDQTRWVVGPLQLAAATLVRTSGDTILIGDTSSPELMRWRANGAPLPPLTLPLPEPPDLRPFLDAQRDEDLAQPGAERQKPYILAAHDARRPLPRYRDFLVATNGDIWVRLFERTAPDSTRYLVLSATGSVRARVSLAPKSRVLTVEPPWLLASLKNDDDVEAFAVIRWDGP